MILLDTSALAKLLVDERESSELRTALANESADRQAFAISRVAVIELRRLGIRFHLAVENVEAVLRPFRILRLTEAMMQLAARLPFRHLGTLDALHVATALAAEARGLLTYDARQGEAAEAEGLVVTQPGH
ncbi:type II toxin-antitoxin system VapC family toxin [Ruania zhangjianzhongii]|uniref:type II toxin-antitoxin system VapC family toxin n=1 Tax=Ruania zhangjianzhongii TaxID=2603206 RepID=UPI0011CB2FED|nr:type II toxin-antitoxin system VapC family toxin [Ruania zhangjianzhongii]